MEAEAPPASAVAGPSTLWGPGDRRGRKAGAANIFGGVKLRQLQKLFQASGDRDADQRARLVWDHSGEAGLGLAQALIGLRARSRRSRPRAEVVGDRWLRAFNHLRIGETSVSRQRRDTDEESSDADSLRKPDTAPTEQPVDPSASGRPPNPQRLGNPPTRPSPTPKKGGGSDPERYLHRIIH